MYDIILLDLDGTITDTGLGITNAVTYALSKFGIEETDLSKLYRFIGPPLIYSFHEYYGLDEAQTKEAVGYYREYYSAKGVFENELYDDVRELILELKKRGKTVMLATSKPDYYSEEILRQHELIGHFDFLSSATLDGSRSVKKDVILHALSSNNIVDKDKVLMVGDRMHDIVGAKECGIKSAAVLYGFGSREEFEEYGADYIIDRPLDLLNII